MFRGQRTKLGKVLLGMFSMISFAAVGISKTNPLEEEVENMISENFSGKRSKENTISVSDQDILELIENKLSETGLKSTSALKDRDIKSIIALNALDTGHFNYEELSHNKLEIEYDHYIDYDGITSYSILNRGKIIMEDIDTDEFPELVKNRIDEDADAYKNPKIELGIESELEYENNKEHSVKISHEWISPFKSFNSEI